METLKLEENDAIKASLVAEYFPNAELTFLAVVQTEPFNKVGTITLNHYQMRVLRDWLNHSLGNFQTDENQPTLEEMELAIETCPECADEDKYCQLCEKRVYEITKLNLGG